MIKSFCVIRTCTLPYTKNVQKEYKKSLGRSFQGFMIMMNIVNYFAAAYLFATSSQLITFQNAAT